MSRKVIRDALLVAALIWLPWVLWEILKSYVLGTPDYKFGAEGAIVVVAALKALMALFALASWGVVHLAMRKLIPISDTARLVWTGAAGITLSVLSYMPPLGVWLFGDIGAIAATWGAICVVVMAIIYGAVGMSSKLTTRWSGP
jgi:hypothetical protein